MKTYYKGSNNPNYREGGFHAICLTCGKSFKTSPAAIKNGREYCSIDCYNKVRAKKKPPRDVLINLYTNQGLSTIKIGNLLKIDNKTVYYWLKKYGIHIRTHSELAKIKKPPVGRKTREKMSRKAKERWTNPAFRSNITNKLIGKKHSDAHKNKISESLIGNQRRKGIPHTEEAKKKISKANKEHWKDLEYVRKVMTGLNYKPNNSELLVKRMIENNNLPFDYVGDGKMVVDGKCPDFISRDGSKKIIEVFGEPWHDPKHSDKIHVKPIRTEEARLKFFNKLGYKCLILWHEELVNKKRVLKKLKEFSEAMIG